MVNNNISNADFEILVDAATKAPSGHNSQPWLFQKTDDKITIYPNMNEALSVVDSTNRELFISLGAATENLCIAASCLGYDTDVRTDDTAQSIVIQLKKMNVNNIEVALLQNAIATRQTNRRVYTSEYLPYGVVAVLQNLPSFVDIQKYIIAKSDPLFSRLRAYVEKGNQIQMEDTRFKKELLEYIRFNKKQEQENPTGLSYRTMGSPSLPKFIAKPIVKLYLRPNKQNKSDLAKIDSSSHFVLFTSKHNTFENWVNMGRTLERFTLTATQMGIAHAYMNQPCEVLLLAEDMRRNISLINNEYPTLLLRIGYAKPAPYSSRKPIKDVIIN